MASLTQTTWTDDKAARFRNLGERPLARIFDFTLQNYIGDVKGKSIMDVGCGDGRFCRALKSNGASRVVGVDISADMIRYAEDCGGECEYYRGNACSLGKIGEFDFITSSGLLVYAETVSDLAAMAENFYVNLKPDGKFFSIALNCLDENWDDALPPYLMGSVTRLEGVGEAKRVRFDVNDFSATLSYFEPQIYEKVFAKVGFKIFEFKPVIVKYSHEPKGYWDAFEANPSHLCYVGQK